MDDLRGFHARHLATGRASVIVAGDVDPSQLADELGRRLSGWQESTGELPVLPEPGLAGRPVILLLDRPGAPQAVIRAGHLGINRHDPAFEQMLLFNQVLGGQFTSRLNEKLREERGFTYGIRSQFECRRSAGPFSIGTSVQSDRLAEAIEDIRGELTAVLTDRPPTIDELDKARRSLIEGQPRHLETPSSLVSRFGSLLVHGLPPEYEASFADRLNRIDRESVIEAARARVHPDALVVVVVADASQVRAPLESLGWAETRLIED